MLPDFNPSRHTHRAIANMRETATALKLLWDYASSSDKNDPEFLLLLMRCTWINRGERDATRRWRNGYLADWLDIDNDDENLIAGMVDILGISRKDARWFVTSDFGFVHFYTAHRPSFEAEVPKHTKIIAAAFARVSKVEKDVEAKVRAVATPLFALKEFKVPNGWTSITNGLTPAIACMDPQRRFPVVNGRTMPLLRALGHDADVEGALALFSLIGSRDIASSFHLDEYSAIGEFEPVKPWHVPETDATREMGFKSEVETIAQLARKVVVITHKHNELTNKFMTALTGWHAIEEKRFDCLIRNWKKGRDLLIEAKTSTSGTEGRTQLRQAIGQLFDYRWSAFPTRVDKVDLALLTPAKPASGVLGLLKELDIEALWFEEGKLKGTIDLLPDD